MKQKTLTDMQAYERLIVAANTLPDPEIAQSIHAKTAIASARAALLAIQMSLLTIIDRSAS